MPWELHLRTDEAKSEIDQIVFEATEETFQQDILTEAQNLAPVRTGTLVASLQVEVKDGENGPEAEIYSTSGYGGYVETGTKRMPAQPFIWPAFLHGIAQLPQRVYRKLNR